MVRPTDSVLRNVVARFLIVNYDVLWQVWVASRSRFQLYPGVVPKMIDVKQAVIMAFEFANGLKDVMNATNLTLEEVELSDDGKLWLVTLSYFDSAEGFEGVLKGSNRTRRYKLLRMDADSGEVLGMVFRE